MSSINLSGNASGSGTLTITSPNTNSSYTLALPEEAGTITTSNSPYSTFRNRIINGDMRIDQRNAGAAVTTSGAYPVDRFFVVNSSDGAFSAQQDSTAPAGFVNSLKVTATTADGTLTTTQQVAASQRIEGTNISDLAWGTANAKAITLSFWARSSLTGTFGGSLRNGDATRSYAFTYSISAADTWEQKAITIAGDTSGTWLTTTGRGIEITFGLGVGPDRSGTAGSWAGANYASATGAVSVIGTLNATWYVTGVQLEVGSVATPFERRPYGTELSLCQRYLFKMSTTGNFGPYGMGHGINTTSFRAIIKTAQTMRAQPTLSFSTASGFQWSFGNALSAISAADYGLDAFSVDCTSTGLSAFGGYMLTSANNTTSSITASAEL